MPPKPQFSKDQIVDAAFEIARAEGIDSVTTRKVAQKLGSSIAPIYVNFNDIEELKRAVVHKAFAISQQMLMEQSSEEPFLDIGLASLRFAKEYSVLFRDLIMKNNQYMQDYEPVLINVLEYMNQDPMLAGLTDEDLKNILFVMRVFTTGLSVMVANGLLPESFDDTQQKEILESVGTDIVTAARLRREGAQQRRRPPAP